MSARLRPTESRCTYKARCRSVQWRASLLRAVALPTFVQAKGVVAHGARAEIQFPLVTRTGFPQSAHVNRRCFGNPEWSSHGAGRRSSHGAHRFSA